MSKTSYLDKSNRIQRLLGLLRSDDIWTTEKLARELEVSHRTLMRDLSDLKNEGYPIESDRGRGGGVRLNGRYGIGRLSLSHYEVINMLVSLAICESLNSPLLSDQLRSVRFKIAQSFPDNQRATISDLRKRILVGQTASLEVQKSYTKAKESILKPITVSFFESLKVEITYVSEKNEKTKRVIEPQYLLLNWPIWYILSFDYLRNDIRLFRIDRIKSSVVLNENIKKRSKSKFIDFYKNYFDFI